MTSYRYDTSSLAADYARSGTGVVVAGGLLVAANPLPAIAIVLAAATGLFAVYGVRTGLRHVSELEVDSEAIRVRAPLAGVFDREVLWASLTEMKLSYFSTQRDRRAGWMQLRVRGGGRIIRCDSALADFPRVVEHAYRAACARNVAMSRSTVTNLKSMGLARDMELPL